MDAVEIVLLGGFAAVVLAAITYAAIRVTRESRADVDPLSALLARIMLIPRRFDPLVARRLMRREIFGLVLLVGLMIVAVLYF